MHDIDRICPPDHDLWHLGRLRIQGTTENPVFLTAEGTPLDARTGFAGVREPEPETPT